MRWRLWTLVGFACGCACTALSGAGDLAVGGASEEDGGSADAAGEEGGDVVEDGGPSCASPSRCLAAPPGWEGPFAVTLSPGGAAGACAAGFVRLWERIGALDASAPQADCTCTCGAIGGTCSVTLRRYDDESCPGNGSARVLAIGNCVQADYDGFKAEVAPQPSCPADASTSFVPLAGNASALACAPAASLGCTVGACVPPTPPGARLCVRAAGDAGTASCPADWTHEIDVSAGFEDTRGCSPCTCAANAPSCTFSYTLYDGDDCTGAMGTFSDTACHAPDSIDSVKLTASAVMGTCAPSGGQPVGGVTAVPAVTLCCQP